MITTHIETKYPIEEIYNPIKESTQILDDKLTQSNNSIYALVIGSWILVLYILGSLFGVI